MERFLLIFVTFTIASAINLDYLDPAKLQTKTSPAIQQQAASQIISKYSSQVTVEVNPILFKDHKDVFSIRTSQGQLRIRASSGVAAVWGFNYYLKKYCMSQIAWQTQRIAIPSPLPDADEVVVANDRFRYYQNVCTASYSFVWWDVNDWRTHVEWMALNGINLALAPVAQEAAWARVYRSLGMTQDEIDQHFTGPAFLSWLRMGNVHGWGGPLVQTWHDRQRNIQDAVVDYMFQLGIIPVFPAFNGHVPTAFSRLYPNVTYHAVDTWNKFNEEYCCGLFLEPTEPLFATVGRLFLREITAGSSANHIYTADPFNEIKISNWSKAFIVNTARAIFSAMSNSDESAVWLLQNWMFVSDPILWPKSTVQAFLTAVPNGRMLVLDLQSEQWPQYYLYEQYFGQPYIWCMLHNFGGTLGMFGSMPVINNDVYYARSRVNSTMIGIGLTPEGINQNYVVYDLMLESAWRKGPVNLEKWVGDYAERRYGCNDTNGAWKSLLKSVYSFDGLNKVRGKYAITRRPSFKIKPWAWYKSKDLFDAFRKFVFVSNSNCFSPGFYHDLVDVTRQAMQYRAEQLYVNIVDNQYSNSWVFNSSMNMYLDAMTDMMNILATSPDFRLTDFWLSKARMIARDDQEQYYYDLNARNQITLWGPNGEISDYACKQWAGVFQYYYIPRWTAFLSAALDAKVKDEQFDERATQSIIKKTVEETFLYTEIIEPSTADPRGVAYLIHKKWGHIPDLKDLPNTIIRRKNENGKMTTMADIPDDDEISNETPTVMMIQSTTPEMK